MSVDSEILYSILFIYVLIVVSPGPNFVLVCKYALGSSRGLAFVATIGLAIGATINASLTIFGVGALINNYPYFDLIISLMGGSFLIYMGAAGIIASYKHSRDNSFAKSIEKDAVSGAKFLNKGWLSALQVGCLTNLLNPKGIVFFISLYGPIAASASLSTKGLILSLSFMIELAWYGVVIAFLSQARIRRLYARYTFIFDFVLGAILCALGAFILMRVFD